MAEMWRHNLATRRPHATLSSAQQRHQVLSPPLFSPCAWRRPRLGISLDRIGAAFEKERHQFCPTPTAGPAKRRALQQMVAQIQAGTGVENQRCKFQAVICRQMFARASNAVKDRQTKLLLVVDAAAQAGIATLEQHPETGEVRRAIPTSAARAMCPESQRLFEDPEPARIIALPVHPRQ